jgi:hypothetical protein
MTHFDRPESDARRATLNLARDTALWDALLDAHSRPTLYRVFETTVAANAWDAALEPLHPAWRALGFPIMADLDRADVRVLPPDERDYAGVFFGAVKACWESFIDPRSMAGDSLRNGLEIAQMRRRAQLATEPLPLGLPPQSLAVRLPTLRLPDRDPREFTSLLLRPLTPPTGAAPLFDLELTLSAEGLYVHVRPCDADGEPLRARSSIYDSPGCTLLSATWADLGLGDHGPYVQLHDRHTSAVTPTLGSAFDVRFVSGAQRAALLLCTQHDIVRLELADIGDSLSVSIECPGRAARQSAQISYLDRAMAPSPPRTLSPA